MLLVGEAPPYVPEVGTVYFVNSPCCVRFITSSKQRNSEIKLRLAIHHGRNYPYEDSPLDE